MHFVQCLTHSGPGGAQEVVFTLVRTLRYIHPEDVHTVVLPSGGVYGDRFRRLGARVLEAPFDRVSLQVLSGSQDLLRNLHPDAVHSHGKGAGLYARFALRAAGRTRRVHSFHGFHLPRTALASAGYVLLERYLANSTDAVISISESEAEDLGSRLPGVRKKIRIIRNVVDPALIRQSAETPLSSEIAEFFGRHGGRNVVVMVARPDPLKNYDLAFASAAEVMRRRKGAAFLFVGIGSDDPASRKLVGEFRGRVLAVPSAAETAPIVARSAIVMITSRKEGSPLIVLEAQCLGKPVVGTRVAGIRDVVGDGRDGVLCKEDPEEIATALERLLEDDGLYRRMSACARERGDATNVAEWAEGYRTVYAGEGSA